MQQYKRIFIIGHPGAGKALIAKALAEKLGWQFIDADFGLEFKIGRTLADGMGQNGEDAILHCEVEILDFLTKKENIVVTTDASIVCLDKNRQLLSKELTVYLKVSLSIQLERLLRAPKPIFDDIAPEDFLQKLHQQRNDLYQQTANLTIDSDDNNLNEHVSTILNFCASDLDNAVRNPVKLAEKDLIYFHKTKHKAVRLSYQQAACVKLIAQGKTSKEIAQILNISHRTIEGYLAKTIEQLGCSSSKELIGLYFA